jgi:hypothetical protein
VVCSLQLILGNPSAFLSDGHSDTSKLPLVQNTANAAWKEIEISCWFLETVGSIFKTFKGIINQTGQLQLFYICCPINVNKPTI